jgi:DNA polymerase V
MKTPQADSLLGAVRVKSYTCILASSFNSIIKRALTPLIPGDQYRNGASMQMLHATNDTSEIISAVRHCVSSVYRPGYAYAKAGVGLIQLIEPNPEQLNIFGEYQSERSKKLMATIDQINMNGKELFFASNGVDQSWKMQRKLKSPSYTTKLDQVVIIKC